jgi:hypothetical protein
MKYFSDFSVSNWGGRLSVAGVSGLKVTKGVLKASYG